MNRIYAQGLRRFLNYKWMSIPVIVLLFGAIAYFWKEIRTELPQLEDRSMIQMRFTTQEGATYEFKRSFADKLRAIADSLAPEREAVVSLASNGMNFVNVMLPDIQERERTQMEIADALSGKVRRETMARGFVQQQSTFGGRRGGMPVQYVLQATSLDKLQEYLPRFMEKVNESPVFQMADVFLVPFSPKRKIVREHFSLKTTARCHQLFKPYKGHLMRMMIARN